MPFKSISSLKRLGELSGAVTSATSLTKPEAVAFLSTDDVQLGVFPTGSGTDKVHGVSISSGDDVALLGRDVALVRAGDDVWALLDITHTPNMEQVGRDASRLFGSDSGETALSLGWDGRAVEYSVKGRDVNAREFALRGDVKSMDIRGGETFVLVDGEMRVHPGNTPERGALARAGLPGGGSKFDRVSGSKQLVVAFKKGDASLIAAPRRQADLQPKLISLDVPANDVIACRSSLVVATNDGRLLLFDADAISQATMSRAEPRFSMDVPGGEPTAMISVGAGGSPHFFVGTSSGDVLRGTLVAKG